MAFDSQVSNVQSISDLAGLTHEVFRGSVLPAVRWESVTAQMFQNAGEGDFTYVGSKLVGATDLQRPTGALGTSGRLPDAADFDAVNWETTPVRRYRRFAMDNFTEARATGEGAFGDFSERVFDQLWGAFRLMEIRHAIGSSAGTLCKVASRTSTTVWTAKDGYGYSGMAATIMLDEGMVIAWYDVSATDVGGAGMISSINYSNSTVTMAAAWDSNGTAAANNDPIFAATTTSTSADYFDTERNNAKNGLLSIVDPAGSLTTVFAISQATYPRWKPYRKSSSTFDTIEVTEFMMKLAAKSTFPVSASSHTIVMHPGAYATLARSLLTYQRQMGLGKTLEGGYETVKVGQYDLATDEYQLHNVMYAICNEDLYTVSLVEQGFFDDDGSMYSRLADFDGKEGYVRDYCNSFSNRRNRHGALTGISLASGVGAASDYNPVPDY